MNKRYDDLISLINENVKYENEVSKTDIRILLRMALLRDLILGRDLIIFEEEIEELGLVGPCIKLKNKVPKKRKDIGVLTITSNYEFKFLSFKSMFDSRMLSNDEVLELVNQIASYEEESVLNEIQNNETYNKGSFRIISLPYYKALYGTSLEDYRGMLFLDIPPFDFNYDEQHILRDFESMYQELKGKYFESLTNGEITESSEIDDITGLSLNSYLNPLYKPTKNKSLDLKQRER